MTGEVLRLGVRRRRQQVLEAPRHMAETLSHDALEPYRGEPVNYPLSAIRCSIALATTARSF
jgi:hypothetical protein